MWQNEQQAFWANGQGWARFWCNIGGFVDPNETDALGWTPLHHAIDSMSFSERAFFAAMELTPLMSKEYLAKTTQAPSQHMPVPVGYTALHFVMRLVCGLPQRRGRHSPHRSRSGLQQDRANAQHAAPLGSRLRHPRRR